MEALREDPQPAGGRGLGGLCSALPWMEETRQDRLQGWGITQEKRAQGVGRDVETSLQLFTSTWRQTPQQHEAASQLEFSI